jgi:hypothetical protein
MKALKIFLFAVGIFLLALNVYGIFKTLRNPEIYTEELRIHNRIGDVKIKYPEIKQMLVRKDGESEREFAVRVNSIVHDGFAHYWKREGIEKYNMRIPAWENYMLYAASYIKPAKYERYEFSNYKKNLERGVGLCSSHSIVVKGVLQENGIKAELLDVGGHHVVVRAELDKDTAFILDPDFGVYVPYDTGTIHANPELVRAPYQHMAALYYPDAKEPYTTEFMVDLFGHKKYVYDVKNWFEGFSYIAIWVLPFLLMLPYALQLSRQRKTLKA